MHKILTREIHDKSPCGISIKNTQEYYSIKEKYSSLMLNISSKEIKSKMNMVKNVRNDVINILENKSKDLELFLWFIYLSIMIEGIDGFISSLEIILEIIEKYFKIIHPIKTEYTSTEDEIIEVKVNLINQIDLKTSPLINEHTYLDNEEKTINITTIIQFKNASDPVLKEIVLEHSNSCIQILEKIEKSVSLLENISSELLHYDNYQNNQEIIIPKFKNLKQNFAHIKMQIETHVTKHETKDANFEKPIKTQKQVINQNTKYKTIDTSDKDIIIKEILSLAKNLTSYNSHQIIAYAIEFCILKIPQDSIELAKIIRKNNLISNFIEEVIKFKDGDNNINETENVESDIIHEETQNNIDNKFPEL